MPPLVTDTMREAFLEHHKLSEAEFDDLWKQCTFALDANVLLNIYRYADATRGDLFRVLRHLGDRVWVPYQVAKEFYARRLGVIVEQRKQFDQLSAALAGALRAINDGRFVKSGFLKVSDLDALVRPGIEKAVERLTAERAKHPDLLDADPYLEELVGIIATGHGERGSDEQREKDLAEAAARLARDQPPGYLDKDKPEPNRYGDVLIWFELLRLGETTKRPVVFVTDDNKEDWWLIVEGKKLAPRPELRVEMRARAGVAFHLYNPVRLLETVGNTLDVKVPATSIDDARRVAEMGRDEWRRLIIERWSGESQWKRDAVEAAYQWLTSQGYDVAIRPGTIHTAVDLIAQKGEERRFVVVRLASPRPLYVDKLRKAIADLERERSTPATVFFVANTLKNAKAALEALGQFASAESGLALSTQIVVGYLDVRRELIVIGSISPPAALGVT
jgi:hypothetical protein